MSEDLRFNSIHLSLARRELFREARTKLLESRGWMTLAGEEVRDWLAPPGEESAVPLSKAELLPATQFVLIDQRSGVILPLHIGFNTAGRFANNDIVFSDTYVSRRHCTFLVHARGPSELHDTASRNGTFVNGQRVTEPVKLYSGDQVRIACRDVIFATVADYRSCEIEESSHSGSGPLTASL
jgi:pSer/pThr/pTyr-binding forkhead associated (FHA) protein